MTSAHQFPVDQHKTSVLIYRWIVFLLAAGYTVYQLVIDGDYSNFAGPFRFLTIWALLLSFFVASRNLAFTEFRSERFWSVTIMVTAVLNAIVVALYWRLFLDDPASVTNGDGPPPWHQQFYLHGLGPLLQWIDALFIAAAFTHWWRGVLPLILIILAYVAWIEFAVSPLSDRPVGMVTSGFPYPFLNSLDFAGRLQFYMTAAIQALVMLVVFALFGWAIGLVRTRLARPQEAP